MLSSSFLFLLYYAVVKQYDSGTKIGATSSAGSQILIFHFPGVIEGVKGGVPNKVPQWPLAGRLILGVQLPDGLAIGLAMRLQSLVGQHSFPRLLSLSLLRREHAEHPRPI